MSLRLILYFSKYDSFSSVSHSLSVFGPIIVFIFCPSNFETECVFELFGKCKINSVSIVQLSALSIHVDLGEYNVKILFVDLIGFFNFPFVLTNFAIFCS